MKISTKVMVSYDYNHFEHSLEEEIPDNITAEDKMILRNNLRITCQMLCDESVRQYKEMRKLEGFKYNNVWSVSQKQREVLSIKETIPESEYTEEIKAKIKACEELEFKMTRKYDYFGDCKEFENKIPF